MSGPHKVQSGSWEFAGYEPSLPVTEKSNPLTREIDKADPRKIIHLLRQCDAEIFRKEWEGLHYQTLHCESLLQNIIHIAKKVENILKDPEGSLIVLSGCGTSGRLAFLVTTSFNGLLKELQKKPIFSYIIAGGDKALLTSQEAPEDSPQLGAEMLKKVCTGKKRVLFIGISCGLSAPFVAGQLNFCMNNSNIFTPVVIGFNPVNMARNEPVQGWPLTFRQVMEKMEEMQKTHRAFIINPAVGPEAISGSSRMKGGSATKVLLEIMLLAGHEAAFCNKEISPKDVSDRLKLYERVHEITYSQSDKVAFLVEQSGSSLQKRGHVYYIGWGTLGLIGIIDASECIPTFGADVEDIRGFVSEGYDEMRNKEGNMTSLGREFCISHKDFVSIFLPNLNESDLIIFVFTLNDDLDDVERLVNQASEKTSNLHAISHASLGQDVPDKIRNLFATVLNIAWPTASSEHKNPFFKRLQQELSTKWVLNAVSTGGHILKGKIYFNYMMDLKVTNSKLFKRALSILQHFTNCSSRRGHQALLQAIYDTEEATEEIDAAEVAEHTKIATTKCRVVPTALVILIRNCTLSEAKSRLDAYRVIKDAVKACLSETEAQCHSSPGRT